MSKYDIGKDVGELFARVEALEKKIQGGCGCGGEASGSIATVRVLSEEEQKERQKGSGKKAAQEWCIYQAQDNCAALGIRFGDDLCVTCVEPCPRIRAMRIVNAAGAEICTIAVDRLSHACSGCTSRHKFVWV